MIALLLASLLAADPAPRVNLEVGDVWVLRLPCHGDPCRWEIFDLDAAVLARDRLPEWEASAEGGVQVYRLRAVRAGKTRLTLIHGGSRACESRACEVAVGPRRIDEESMEEGP